MTTFTFAVRDAYGSESNEVMLTVAATEEWSTTAQELAEGFVIGRRFHSEQVVRLADARPLHLGKTTQVWEATVSDDATAKAIAHFRCTQMILWPRR